MMSKHSDLLVATHNVAKVRELSQSLAGIPLRLRLLSEFPSIPEAEETGATFIENATIKALQYSTASGLLSLADDSGLAVDALDGSPGIYSARYAGPHATYSERMSKLLEEITATGDTDRRARFICVIALADPSSGLIETFDGKCEGRIAHEPRGAGGFGYDPIFIPEGHAQTFGELPDEIKQTISHRAQAIDKACRFLRKLFPYPGLTSE